MGMDYGDSMHDVATQRGSEELMTFPNAGSANALARLENGTVCECQAFVVTKLCIAAVGLYALMQTQVEDLGIRHIADDRDLERAISKVRSGGSVGSKVVFFVEFGDFSPVLIKALCDLSAADERVYVLLFGELAPANEARKRVIVKPKLNFKSGKVAWTRLIRQILPEPKSAQGGDERSWGKARTLRQSARTVLTPRQSEVLSLLLRGYSNKQIGNSLGITESTVKAYVGSLMDHFGVSRRTHLMALNSPSR